MCHQNICPSLTCVHTVTLSGHCCPICRDQLPFINGQGKCMCLIEDFSFLLSTTDMKASFFQTILSKRINFILYILVPMSQSRFGLTIIIIFSILILILIFIIIILIFILLRGGHRSLSPSDQLPTVHHRSPIISHHPTGINSKPSDIFPYVKYDLMSISNENTNNTKQGLSLLSNVPLTSLEQTSTHSMIGTNTTTIGTSSSNNELEPGTWTEDDPMLHCSASSSNDDDDDEVEEHEIIISDNDESHQQQPSHPQIHMNTGPPTIIYV